jgi:hypothetical protein
MKTASAPSILRMPRAIAFALCMTLALSAHAQQASNAALSQDDSNRQLLQRINDLEAKVKDLQEKQATSVPTAAPDPVAAPSEVNSVNEVLKLSLLGDLGYRVHDLKPSTNTFGIGSLDLFMTAHLSDRVGILAEVLFTAHDDNTISPDIERLLLQYKYNDFLTAAVGGYHTSIGYYNTTFHQGAWFQTALDRPFMYAFDDGGGFLPLQQVGVTVNGLIPSGKLGLRYVVEVGNGRNNLLGAPSAQPSRDSNNGKAFNIAMSARPRWFQGWDAGFSIYHDHLTFSDNINHDELISTVHAVYRNSHYEILNEAILIRHVGTRTGAPGVFHTPAFYTQLSRSFGAYRPYFRYQYINAGDNEPIYGNPANGPVVGRRNGPSLGLRYDFTEHTAFKLQYDRLQARGLRTSNQLGTQFSFMF